MPLTRYQPRTATGFARPVGAGPGPPPRRRLRPASGLADFLDGDGRVDLLAGATAAALMLAHRDASGEWLSVPDVVEEQPAGPPTDLTDPRVFCGDMTGDGTPDLVRVDGSGVSYWP